MVATEYATDSGRLHHAKTQLSNYWQKKSEMQKKKTWKLISTKGTEISPSNVYSISNIYESIWTEKKHMTEFIRK